MNNSGIRHSRSIVRARARARARARTGAVAACALVSLAVLTGCGGSGSADSATGASPSASAAETSAAASAVKPLTSGELESAALVKADLTGYEVSTPAKAEIVAADGVEVSGEECVPLGRAVAGTAVGKPAAATYRRVTGAAASGEAALDINTGTVTLASYASAAEATAALKSVADAVTACAGGFQWTAGGEQLDVGKVTVGTAPKAGDEAVAFTAVTPLDGVDAPWKVVVFRDGATLAHFTVFNVGATTSGKDFTFPADLVTAQADKLA
ncbi:hypothetical protein [Streptomyces sp. SID12501]|uniref:Sensor domain-containing protein n=1 Tax=Streptomyces sp. SID12501 TaxID=2706042 RepID=A0A6B3BUH3_9ACTN|nr:hypothetical protein [Streptomyces sp. SID12501]NEC87950.1 hypothetical protein [Streptomyces sp. SID12501]